MARLPLNLKSLNGAVGEYYPEAGKLVFPRRPFPYVLNDQDVSELSEPSEKEKLEWLVDSFAWGKVTKVHSIGKFQILETPEGKFHSYFSFEDTNRVSSSLEGALLICIAVSTGDVEAAKFAAKVLSLK